MTDFVIDDVALPSTKVDVKPVTNATRQISAADVNAIFTAIDDIRDTIRGNAVSVTTFGAVGDGTTDDAAAFALAITAAATTIGSGGSGAFVSVPKGVFIIGTQLVLPNGVGLRGAGPNASILKAKSTFNGTSLITNEDQDGTQEFAFLESLQIQGNKGGGAVCSVAVVNFVSLFINSYISHVVILDGSNVGLRIAAAGTPGGSGPVYIENTWVVNSGGHGVLFEEEASNSGAFAGICCVNLTSEHQGSNKSAIYLLGLNSAAAWSFYNTHIEQGTAATGRTCITLDGVQSVLFDGVQLLADAATVSAGIVITNVIRNHGIQIRNVYNPNLISTLLSDLKNTVTIGAGTEPLNYVTPDVTYQGGPKFRPSSTGKSLTFQNSLGTDRSWFDFDGRLTGASPDGAGVTIRSDASNDRPLAFINNAANRSFAFYYPDSTFIRFRYITSGIDAWDVSTAGVFRTWNDTSIGVNGGACIVTAQFRITSEISPSQLTANQNDYNPSGFSTATIVLLTSDASRDITGFAATAAGRKIWVYNIGAQNIVLKHQSASSSAANRIIGTAGADVTLTPNRGAHLYYSNSQTRWLVMTDNL